MDSSSQFLHEANKNNNQVNSISLMYLFNDNNITCVFSYSFEKSWKNLDKCRMVYVCVIANYIMIAIKMYLYKNLFVLLLHIDREEGKTNNKQVKTQVNECRKQK